MSIWRSPDYEDYVPTPLSEYPPLPIDTVPAHKQLAYVFGGLAIVIGLAVGVPTAFYMAFSLV